MTLSFETRHETRHKQSGTGTFDQFIVFHSAIAEWGFRNSPNFRQAKSAIITKFPLFFDDFEHTYKKPELQCLSAKISELSLLERF